MHKVDHELFPFVGNLEGIVHFVLSKTPVRISRFSVTSGSIRIEVHV